MKKVNKRKYKPQKIKTFYKSILSQLYPSPDNVQEAAEALGLSYSTVQQARDHGNGSSETIGALIAYGLNFDLDKGLPKLISSIQKTSNSENLDIIQGLLMENLGIYSTNEIIVWLKLLLEKGRIETELGVRKKPGRPKKKTKSSQ